MKEPNITKAELQSICDNVSEELLDNLPQTDLTIDDKHDRALRVFLSAVRKQFNIPDWRNVVGFDEKHSYKQNVYNEIQRLLHSSGIDTRPLVVDFLKKVFGEEANFGDL